MASVPVDLATAAADTNGYAWAKLATPLKLPAGASFYLVSSELTGGDQWFDEETMVQSAMLSGFATAVWGVNGTWNESPTDNDPGFSSGRCYGPVNLQFE